MTCASCTFYTNSKILYDNLLEVIYLYIQFVIFYSGGCKISIKGTNLDSVSQPKLIVYTVSGTRLKTEVSNKPQVLNKAG